MSKGESLFSAKNYAETIKWDEDPLVFNYHNEIPGKTKMHTKRLELEDWVKIDKSYIGQMNERKRLWKLYPEEIHVSQTDESAAACKWELFETLVDYLPQRFPYLFEKRENCIYNKVLDEEVSTDRNDPECPLIRAGRLTQEDWVIIEWNDTEQGYVLTSGIVYFPMRWSLQKKFQRGVAMIHEPVKPFMEHLVKYVYDVFKKMQPDAPLWRANWAVFNDLEGPLDLFSPTGSLDRNGVNKTTVFEGEATGRELTFRAEYQTLRKLPKTRCIVFGIRTYQRYLEEFKKFPVSDSKGLITAIENLSDDFVEYKGAKFWQESALQYLQYIIDQRKGGEEKPVLSNNSTSSVFNSGWFLPAVAGTALGVAVTGFIIHRTLVAKS